jgi:phosphoglycerate dehydrogenase-like enzyme
VPTVEQVHEMVAGADAVLTLLTTKVDDAFLDAAGPQLKVVANVAVGYNNIDVAACARRGVVCTNTPGVLTEATADIAVLERPVVDAPKTDADGWTAEGVRELQKIPFFVRGKAKRNTERYAAEKGLAVIGVETLYEAKAHYAR